MNSTTAVKHGGERRSQHFFGPDPRLRRLVGTSLTTSCALRGDHDYRKVYAAAHKMARTTRAAHGDLARRSGVDRSQSPAFAQIKLTASELGFPHDQPRP